MLIDRMASRSRWRELILPCIMTDILRLGGALVVGAVDDQPYDGVVNTCCVPFGNICH